MKNIGEGHFGCVYRLELKTSNNETIEVAVKSIKVMNHGLDSKIEFQEKIKDFVMEGAFLVQLAHRNILKIIGFCINGFSLCMVTEYSNHRDLERFLKLELRDEYESSFVDEQQRQEVFNKMHVCLKKVSKHCKIAG